MNTTLFDISEEYRSILQLMMEWAEDHDGDITDFDLADRLDELEGSIENKAVAIGLLIKEQKAFGDAIVGEGQAFFDLAMSYKKRGEAKLNAAARLKQYLNDCLPDPFKLETEKVRIRRQKNGGVEPVELLPERVPEDLPKDCQIVKVEMDVAKVRAQAVEMPDMPGSGLYCRYVFADDGKTPVAVVKPRGSHIRIE